MRGRLAETVRQLIQRLGARRSAAQEAHARVSGASISLTELSNAARLAPS